MTVNKITTPPTPQAQIDKINEIIDNLGGGGGSVDIDGVTITKNSSDEIQTVAVKDNRSGNALKLWSGITSQVPGTTDANTLYFKTDDTDVTLSLLNLLYPVGALYIGTMQTCPLQSLGIGTWQLVATDRVLQGAGTRGAVGSTVNESLPNITGSIGDINETTWAKGFANSEQAYGAFFAGAQQSKKGFPSASDYSPNCSGFGFDASRSSSTYQNNAPVQQDAYLVNIWERVS